jgi:hypothetical protein
MKIVCRTYHDGSFKEWSCNDSNVKTVYHKSTWFNENCFYRYRQMLTPWLTKVAQSSILEPQPEQKVMP